MKILFDSRWTPDLAPADMTAERAEEFLSLERTASRIGAAIQRTFVWAQCEDFDELKIIVRDVRILHDGKQLPDGWVVEVEYLQVLLLEGWRTPTRVWTDEESIDEIEGVQ